METLPLFIVLGCSLALNLVLAISTACQSSKIAKLQDENENLSNSVVSLGDEYMNKHNRLVKTEERLNEALRTIEEMKQPKEEVKPAKKTTVKKVVKAETTTKTTRRRTTKKEEK